MKRKLHPPSEEQQLIIETLNNKNIKADCVAGSGKTTSVLHICKTYSKSQVLLMTYNKKLKKETREKIIKYKINNCEVHTYHSFCKKYYGESEFTDICMYNVINNKTTPIISYSYDIIVFDEAQDMKKLYYEFSQKAISDNSNDNIKICIFGDVKQEIYGFSGADYRYLSLSEYIYNNKYKWRECKLTKSYRVTNQIANFINKCLLGEERIKAVKDGPKPKYFVCDVFSKTESNVGYTQILRLLTKYSPENIFILAPSVKMGDNDSPVRILANLLSDNKIPIYVPLSDDGPIDDDIVKKKIVFCTFHQSKGLEREAVIIFNFDSSYFHFFNVDKNIDRSVCPNIFYVALTRCMEELVLLHGHENAPIDFLTKNQELINEYLEYNNSCFSSTPPIKSQKIKNISVTNFIKNISSYKILEYKQLVNIKDTANHINNTDSNVTIKFTNKIFQNDMYENVSDINAIAIMSYNEYVITKHMTIYEEMVRDHNRMNSLKIKNSLDKFIRKPNFTIRDITELSNIYIAYRSGYIYKIRQITNHNWITESEMSIACERFNDVIYVKNKITSDDMFYEIPVCTILHGMYEIAGAIDAIDTFNFIVYEFKCVEMIQDEHFIQLIIYSNLLNSILDEYEHIYIKNKMKDSLFYTSKHLYQITTHKIYNKIDILYKNRDKLRYILWNILDNKMYEIDIKKEASQIIVNDIYNEKFYVMKPMDDQTFITTNKIIMERYNPKDNKINEIYMNNIKMDNRLKITLRNTYNEYLGKIDIIKNKIKNKIIILDIETNGYCNSRMLQLCYFVYDDERLISENNTLVKPEGFKDMGKIFRYSYEYVTKNGQNIQVILDKLYSELKTAKLLVIHNSKFDLGILIGEYRRQYNMDAVNILTEIQPIKNVWESKPILQVYCTMTNTKDIVNVKSKRGHIKNPRLDELYMFLFNKGMNNEKQHDAYYDTKCLAKCYFEIRKRYNRKIFIKKN